MKTTASLIRRLLGRVGSRRVTLKQVKWPGKRVYKGGVVKKG